MARSRWLKCASADDLELAVLREFEEQPRQRHRVGPARQPDEHTRAGRQETVAADGAADLLVKRSCQVAGTGHKSQASTCPGHLAMRLEALGLGL